MHVLWRPQVLAAVRKGEAECYSPQKTAKRGGGGAKAVERGNHALRMTCVYK
jgi:hypothetical protein